MAQVTISDEHYQTLAALAQARGLSPDLLADSLIAEQLIAADQRAFWGDDIEERIEAALSASVQQPQRILSDDVFLADLRARLKDPNDADA